MFERIINFIETNSTAFIIALAVPTSFWILKSIVVWIANFFKKGYNRLKGDWFAYSISTKTVDTRTIEYVHVSKCVIRNWLFFGFWLYGKSEEWSYIGKLNINERNFIIKWRGIFHPEKMLSAYKTPFKVKDTTILLGGKTCINTNCNPVCKFEILAKNELSDEKVLSHLKNKLYVVDNPIISD